MRIYSYKPQPVLIEPVEAYRRVLDAICTLDRLPGPKKYRVQSNWPKHFAFHAEAIRWVIFAGKAREDKNFKRLRAQDFDDINLEPPRQEDVEDWVFRDPPSRAAITDADIAGAWFNALALLPENIDEFMHAAEAWRRRKRREPWVDDQTIVAMHARGASLKTIGTNLHGGKINEHQVEGRIHGIAGRLADIANGRASLVDPRPGETKRGDAQAHLDRGRARA